MKSALYPQREGLIWVNVFDLNIESTQDVSQFLNNQFNIA
jgi:hypothetical protein